MEEKKQPVSSMHLALELLQRKMDETPDEDHDILTVAREMFTEDTMHAVFNYLWKIELGW